MACLVLVENEVTYEGKYDHWLDSTGESYQFPNQYRNKIQPGTRFVYYRGVRRSHGRRATAEYFGVGRIGTVWRDPEISHEARKSTWRWFCSIDDFRQFPVAVPSRFNGLYLESIANALGWRTGVRKIDDKIFDRILQLSGLPTDPDVKAPLIDPLPPISEVHPTEVTDSWQTLVTKPSSQEPEPNSDNATRYSPRAKRLGDRAEEIVLNWLRSTLPPSSASTVAWVAKQGRMPGWDIEFIGDQGLTCVEVKGTTAALFRAFDVTAREWESAKQHGPRYWLVLVTQCASSAPMLVTIRDPYAQLEGGQLQLEPIVWRVRRSS